MPSSRANRVTTRVTPDSGFSSSNNPTDACGVRFAIGAPARARRERATTSDYLGNNEEELEALRRSSERQQRDSRTGKHG